jgi:hypothetical protein
MGLFYLYFYGLVSIYMILKPMCLHAIFFVCFCVSGEIPALSCYLKRTAVPPDVSQSPFSFRTGFDVRKPTSCSTKKLRVDNFVHHRIASAVKRVELVSDRVSYIVLRGRWCNIVVLNVHAPSEDKSDDSKNNFYEELEQVFDHFPRYHLKILLRDFNAKVGRENVFKPTIGNESLHQDRKSVV